MDATSQGSNVCLPKYYSSVSCKTGTCGTRHSGRLLMMSFGRLAKELVHPPNGELVGSVSKHLERAN
jgi:hypothetical protein